MCISRKLEKRFLWITSVCLNFGHWNFLHGNHCYANICYIAIPRFSFRKRLLFSNLCELQAKEKCRLKENSSKYSIYNNNYLKQRICTSISDSVLQFCSIFSLCLQNCNISLVLFLSYLSIPSKHGKIRQSIFCL